MVQSLHKEHLGFLKNCLVVTSSTFVNRSKCLRSNLLGPGLTHHTMSLFTLPADMNGVEVYDPRFTDALPDVAVRMVWR